jgi:hypothetical protein
MVPGVLIVTLRFPFVDLFILKDFVATIIPFDIYFYFALDTVLNFYIILNTRDKK